MKAYRRMVTSTTFQVVSRNGLGHAAHGIQAEVKRSASHGCVENCIEDLLLVLSITGPVVMCPSFHFGSRTSRILHDFDRLRNVDKLAETVTSDKNHFPLARACLAGLPIPAGLSLPPLM